MKAFISYSHQDGPMLDMLHKHLAQLHRDGIISAWTDREIPAGGNLDQAISEELHKAKLFLALLSPDYIASNYCYEKEFSFALNMQEQGKLLLVPIILEPCDWLSTPFKKFKALPKDGKAVSTWENKNNAFLDVVQNIRKLITLPNSGRQEEVEQHPSKALISRNYRVQKDFDSIEKLEFIEKTFHDIKEYLKRYIAEVTQLENIKVRTFNETDKIFECLLVNRNKIDTESRLKISIGSESQKSGFSAVYEEEMAYTISRNERPAFKGFKLSFDDYHLFWMSRGSNFYSNSRDTKELEIKEMAEVIWNEWLESVGIL